MSIKLRSFVVENMFKNYLSFFLLIFFSSCTVVLCLLLLTILAPTAGS